MSEASASEHDQESPIPDKGGRQLCPYRPKRKRWHEIAWKLVRSRSSGLHAKSLIAAAVLFVIPVTVNSVQIANAYMRGDAA